VVVHCIEKIQFLEEAEVVGDLEDGGRCVDGFHWREKKEKGKKKKEKEEGKAISQFTQSYLTNIVGKFDIFLHPHLVGVAVGLAVVVVVVAGEEVVVVGEGEEVERDAVVLVTVVGMGLVVVK
jgi:hypothetical protein